MYIFGHERRLCSKANCKGIVSLVSPFNFFRKQEISEQFVSDFAWHAPSAIPQIVASLIIPESFSVPI